jgi:hypothetical protein
VHPTALDRVGIEGKAEARPVGYGNVTVLHSDGLAIELRALSP